MSQATQQSFCPAVQREITSAECSENRASKYACPASGEFNPFPLMNYNPYFELEGRVIRKAMTGMWRRPRAARKPSG